MRVSVRLFARLRDIAGTSNLERELPDGSTARELWDTLEAEFPELDRYRETVSTAINTEYSRMDHALTQGDEVAFLPPVSGG